VSDKAEKAYARRAFLKLGALTSAGLFWPKRGFVSFVVPSRSDSMLVYVGTYTTGKSEGIYLYRLDLASGKLQHVDTTKNVINPSFLGLAPDHRHLYAVNEVEDFGGKKSGAVSAFAVDQKTGQLQPLNQQASLGTNPCYIEVDAGGKFVLVANYSGGNVSVFRANGDGSLGETTDMKQAHGSSINTARQEGPHAHCIVLDPTNRFSYSCDLGTDKIMIFRFDARNGKLLAAEPSFVAAQPGAGPRHLAFHPNRSYVFVLNELNSTVTVYKRDQENGSLKELQSLTTLPKDFTSANTGADIHVSPDGQYLYASNRGHDSIAIFAIDARDGSLKAIGHTPTQGRTPRNFAIDPTGSFLLVANQKSDNIVVFRVDKRSGQLSSTGHVAEVPSPVCLKLTAAF